MRRRVWMSYDLGVQGNYTGLYAWLDRRGALECGDSTAVFFYEHATSIKDEIASDMEGILGKDRRARIYIVYYDEDKGHVTGAFVLNGRKAAPWVGFGTDGGETDEDDEAA